MSISKKNLNLSSLQKNRQNFKFCKYSPICPSLTSCRLENCCRHFLFSGEQLIHNINNIVLLNLKNCRMPPPLPSRAFLTLLIRERVFLYYPCQHILVIKVWPSLCHKLKLSKPYIFAI